LNAVLVLDVLAAVLVVAFVAVAVLAIRRRLITRRGGTFDCSLRLRRGTSGQGWALGVGRYAGDTLEWYRVFSYALRPRRVLARQELEIVDRRMPEGAEVFALLSGAVVVCCREGGGGTVELAMGEDVLTGFLAWLEAASPGQPA